MTAYTTIHPYDATALVSVDPENGKTYLETIIYPIVTLSASSAYPSSTQAVTLPTPSSDLLISIQATATSSKTSATTAADINFATDSRGLSTSDKAGIGLGIPIGAIGFVVILGFLLRQRRKRTEGIKEVCQGDVEAGFDPGLIPVRDDDTAAMNTAYIEPVTTPLGSLFSGIEVANHGPHEVQGDQMFYPRELAGSPGPEPQELPTRMPSRKAKDSDGIPPC